MDGCKQALRLEKASPDLSSLFPIKEILRSLMDAAFLGQQSYLYPIVVQNRGVNIVTPSRRGCTLQDNSL